MAGNRRSGLGIGLFGNLAGSVALTSAIACGSSGDPDGEGWAPLTGTSEADDTDTSSGLTTTAGSSETSPATGGGEGTANPTAGESDGGPTGSSGDSGPPPAGLIFSEDFDGQPDWLSTEHSTCSNGGSDCGGDVPAPWSLLYLDQLGRPQVGPTCEISSAGAIGGAGKGVRFIDDSRGRANAWKADCQLMKDLGETYSDLYFRFDIVWNPDTTLADFNAAKIFRAGYYLPGYFDGSVSGSVFGTDESTRGMVFIDIKREGSSPDAEAHLKVAYRCNPGYKTDCRDFSQALIGPWSEGFADGEPHVVVFRMKVNTGSAQDGAFMAWWDGELLIDDQDVQWTTSGDNPGGFNSFSVGGNQDHNWGCGDDFPDNEMCDDETQEWKHNIDNVKVGTNWDAVQ